MPDKLTSERWISLQKVCTDLGVKRHTIMPWLEQHNMPASTLGKLWRCKKAEVNKWVRSGGTPEEQDVPQ